MLGWEIKFCCEIDKFCLQVLKYHYPQAELYEDITKTDFRKWCGQIDILSAGFPCQPFSIAGKREGAKDDRYLWDSVLRVIKEVEPRWLCFENVTGLSSMVFSGEETTLGNSTNLFGESYIHKRITEKYILEKICRDIESVGYEVQTFIIPACGVGAPHRRDRLWFIACKLDAEKRNVSAGSLTDSGCLRFKEWNSFGEGRHTGDGRYWDTEEDTAGERKLVNWLSKDDGFATNPDSFGSKGGMYSHESQETGEYTCLLNSCSSENFWQEFTIESALCGKDDGLPRGLLTIPFSKWRHSAVKSLGNSVVPQVVLEIYRAIELSDSLFFV